MDKICQHTKFHAILYSCRAFTAQMTQTNHFYRIRLSQKNISAKKLYTSVSFSLEYGKGNPTFYSCVVLLDPPLSSFLTNYFSFQTLKLLEYFRDMSLYFMFYSSIYFFLYKTTMTKMFFAFKQQGRQIHLCDL